MGQHNSSSFKKEQKLAEQYLRTAAKNIPGSNPALRFVEEVLTEDERFIIGRRVAVAQMILAGKTYFEINEKLRISPNTYSHIRTWLGGESPAYAEALSLAKTKAQAKSSQRLSQSPRRSHVDPLSFAALKRKYPMHLLLFHVVDKLSKEG